MEKNKKKLFDGKKNKEKKVKKKLVNKKILESKRLIKEAKERIKLEKQNIKKNKREQFKKTKIYGFLSRVFSFIIVDRETYSFSEILVVTLVSLVVGAFACFSVLVVISGGKNYFKLSNELSKFVEVYDTLIENYNGDIDKEELINNAINGLVSGVGDIYTSYVDVDDNEQFNELVGGIYEGIGCTIQLTEDGIKVMDVFENSPSEKADLHVGDIILKVDDIDSITMTSDEMANYIKNESDEQIEMVVLRNGEERNITLFRDKVETPVVSSVIYQHNNKKVGYLSISMFTSVASSQFEAKLKKLENDGIDSLIIDVRNNSGGYLTTVTDIVSQLLPKGEIIYQIEKNGNNEVTKDKTFTSREYPIAVLVNESSASASEILAAAIKESYGGYVVGINTYGKGTVQQTKQLSDGSMIKYTIENWLTPLGNWINEVGLEPTHEIGLSDEYYNNPIVENDSQLQKALELVSE